MEKLRSRDALVVKKGNIVLRTAMAGAFVMGQSGLPNTGPNTNIDESFQARTENILQADNKLQPETKPIPFAGSEYFYDLAPYSSSILQNQRPSIDIVQQEQFQTEGEMKLEQYRQESSRIVEALKNDPEHRINKQVIQDIGIYGPIYMAIADYLGIKWEAIPAIHYNESTGSRSKRAFNGETYPYFGAGQRNIRTWPDSLVEKEFEKVFSDIPEVAQIETRHKSDARELSFVGFYYKGAESWAVRNGQSEWEAMHHAFERYSGSFSIATKEVNFVKTLDSAIKAGLSQMDQ